MTVSDLLHYATESFSKAGMKNPKRNAHFFLSYFLNCSIGEIYLNKEKEIDKKIFKPLIKERINGNPWEYIFNSVQFRDLRLEIKKGVFIPRPETEILVQELLENIKKKKTKKIKILDIGTGSGNIAISLAKNFPSISILATDISKTALKIAKLNAIRYNLKNICFLYSDLFKHIHRQKFDIIVSNPPYIPTNNLNKLSLEVKMEPRMALDGGEKGISILQKIINNVPNFLKKQGLLFLEIGIGQNNLLKELVNFQPKLKLIKIIKDYQKIPRIVIIKESAGKTENCIAS